MLIRSPSELQAELLQLIDLFAAAFQSGDITSAERYIDRARRLSPPDNPEINQLYGQLMLAAGELEKALYFLEAALAIRPDPDCTAAYLLALCRDGQIEAALDELHESLLRFACAPDSPLANAASQISLSAGGHSAGWIAIAPDMTLHGEILNGDAPIRVELSSLSGVEQRRQIACDRSQLLTQFRFGAAGDLPVGRIIARANGVPLVGGDLTFPLDFCLDGRATTNNGSIAGWVSLCWDWERALELVLQGENAHRLTVTTTADALKAGRHIFTVDPARSRILGSRITISAVLPDGRLETLPDSPLLADNPAPVSWLAQRPPHFNPTTLKGAAKQIVDILIPVYVGCHETLDCIDAVLHSTGANADIIVIDDATPESELSEALDTLNGARKITLIRNIEHLGFPESINKALELHPDRDVVILNANIEPFGDWLERLRKAAHSADNIATASPLVGPDDRLNRQRSTLISDAHDDAIRQDRIAETLNAGETIQIPPADVDSRCLYIRRDCLATLGDFDSATFAEGYGEDVDFGQRAALSGRLNIVAANIYVRYVGERRPDLLRDASLERNTRLLGLRYPASTDSIETTPASDPIFKTRRRLTEERLTKAVTRPVLYVGVALGGGVERAVRDQVAAARAQGLGTIVLRPDLAHPDYCWLDVGETNFIGLRYHASTERMHLLGFLGRLRFERVELHHFLGFPSHLIEEIFELGAPVDVKIHDYVWYCPRVNLLDGFSRYCGEPPVTDCERCIEKNGSYLGEEISVAALRARSRRWLDRARSITLPTAGVAARLQTQFPGLTFKVKPPEAETAPIPVQYVARRRLKVALIGALGDHKGLSVLLEMARHTAARDLPLEFVVIGFSTDDAALLATGRVFITGEYDEPEIASLIAREAPDVALFLSQFPETWCYTLSHALRAKVPVAALDIGAIAERLRTCSITPLLFPTSSSAPEICDRLLSEFRVSRPAEERDDLSMRPQSG